MEEEKRKQLLDRSQLRPTGDDTAAAVLRGGVGMIPVIGSVLAEVVNHTIPNQRIDRLAAFMEQLTDMLEAREIPELEMKLQQPNNVDLFETGAFQVAQALSSARLMYIAEAVANGIAVEDRSKLHHKRLLTILGELDDEEVALLLAHEQDTSWKLGPPSFNVMAPEERAPWEAARAMWEAAHNKLERLQLLHFREDMRELEVRKDRDGRPEETVHIPQRDQWGERRGRYIVTDLGKLLLEATGLVPKRKDKLAEYLREQIHRGEKQARRGKEESG